jgi:uncharacterized protein GlcG (DUF336 family)
LIGHPARAFGLALISGQGGRHVDASQRLWWIEAESDNTKENQMAKGVTLEEAQKVVEAAKGKAAEIGVPMNIAVVDAGNNLTAFGRMDGAWLGSIDISQNKAYTARSFDMPTGDLQPLIQPGQPLYGIEASNDGRLIVFAGGIPLTRRGRVVGAIGGSVGEDQEVAEAGVAAF